MKRLLIAGNPNAGKTTLFNLLAGTKARTGNYPGVTVEKRTAKVDGVELVDIPGTYSLSARSPEEAVAVEAILETDCAALVVLDATTLARGLYLALQVLEFGIPTVLALNMMDEARERGIQVDVEGLAKALGVEVFPIVASTGEGTEGLVDAALRATPADYQTTFSPAIEAALDELEDEDRPRAWASWALLSVGDDELDVEASVRGEVERVRGALDEQRIDVDEAIIGARYAVADRLCRAHVRADDARPGRGETLDRYLTHPVIGLVVFAGVMMVIFQTLFAWSDPAIGLIEDGIAWTQDAVRNAMPAGVFTDLLAEGVVGGVGNVVVFVPQIAFLFLLIAFLEDSGYLARVAFVIDRVMSSVGLHGKAFVPLLSGFACAIPAVMATRTIADRKDRLVTMLALPLMSCSARLPVYVLITATVFAGAAPVWGVLSVGALVLFSMYALSVVATLVAAALMRRTVLKGTKPALVLELPPYRKPLARNLFATTWRRVRGFLVDAGTVILALTIVLWALLTFPKSETIAAEAEAARQTATSEEAIAEIDNREAGEQLAYSYGGRLGKAIEPAIAPLGMDWRVGVGVIGAFAAREVFVSTLAIVFGVGGDADEESAPLRESLQSATRDDGTKVMTPLAGIALMVFFVLACQCMSTVAVVRRESGTWRWPIFMVVYMSTFAYGAALLVFQVGSLLGFG